METKYSIKTIKLGLKVRDNPATAIKEASAVYRIAQDLYNRLDVDQEHFSIFALNQSNAITGFKVIHSGSINESLISLSSVFRFALLMGAVSIILIHNHPSGILTPSLDDKNLTSKAVNAGKLLDIKILDHIILGDGFYSFAEKGLI